MIKILLVDDAVDVHIMVKKALGDRYDVICAETVAAASSKLKENKFDLFILDIKMPDGDGFQICAQIRNKDETRQVPVIFLTGKTEVEQKLIGFSLGADDYIVKPFNLLELNARVESKINKSKVIKESENEVLKGNLRIQLSSQKVFIMGNNGATEITLTPIELKLLLYLAHNEDRVLSRDQLLTAVWGTGTFITDRTVDKHICSLRQKLLNCSDYIRTVPSFGYTLSTTGLSKTA